MTDDLISRQAAIDAMNELPYGYRGIVWDILNGLPSAERKGKWIRNNDSDHAWKCSVCGCGYTDYILTYCYDCGAKMERGEDE